jgi:hypothetical protein
MLALRRLHIAVACSLLLAVLIEWSLLPLCTWAPKLAGCEHIVTLKLDDGDLHFIVHHADGTWDHHYHGLNCPRHHAPFDDSKDHSKHGTHMPHLESKVSMVKAVPAPQIRLVAALFDPIDLHDVAGDIGRLSDTVAPAEQSPPIESHQTVVLLI